MPPIRFTTNFPAYKLIVEIILPMRLLLYKDDDLWKPRFGCYTMNITTGMLTTASRLDSMPDDFEIIDQHHSTWHYPPEVGVSLGGSRSRRSLRRTHTTGFLD